MIQPLEKTYELVQTLNEYLSSDLTFSEFESAKFKKEVQKIEVAYERDMLMGMFHATQSEPELAFEFFEKAVQKSAYNQEVCENYIAGLLKLDEYSKCYDLALQFADRIKQPSIIHCAMANSLYFLDIDSYSIYFEELRKMELITELENRMNTSTSMASLIEFAEVHKISNSDIKLLGSIAMKVFESNKLSFVEQYVKHKKERSDLNITYVIKKSSCDVPTLLDVNDQFIESIIEHNLDHLPIVVNFTRSEKPRQGVCI